MGQFGKAVVVVPTHRDAEAILASWRKVERELENADPGSYLHETLAADAALLRDEYQQLVESLPAIESIGPVSEVA